MHEFNLIPASYLARRERLLLLRRMGTLFILVFLCFGVVYGTLKALTIAGQDDLASLQSQQNISAGERAELTQLMAEREVLDRKWKLLQSLRSGLSAQELVLSVEQALPRDQIWFTDWRFRREGVVTNDQPTPQAPSYFVQQDSAGDRADWQIQTQMTVRGKARDHAAISTFSRSLLALSHIHEVNLQRTSLAAQRGNEPRLVNFELVIVIKTAAVDNAVATAVMTTCPVPYRLPADAGVGGYA